MSCRIVVGARQRRKQPPLHRLLSHTQGLKVLLTSKGCEDTIRPLEQVNTENRIPLAYPQFTTPTPNPIHKHK